MGLLCFHIALLRVDQTAREHCAVTTAVCSKMSPHSEKNEQEENLTNPLTVINVPHSYASSSLKIKFF